MQIYKNPKNSMQCKEQKISECISGTKHTKGKRKKEKNT
jgi:hypothetical protein